MKMTKYLLLISLLLVTATQSLIANPAIQAFDDENYGLAKRLFAESKDVAEAKLYLGRIAMSEGDFDKAEELLKEALELKPNDANYHLWFANISGTQAGNASIFSAPGYASDSKKHFIKAVELDPENVQALVGLIAFYTQAPGIVGGSTKKALKLTDKLIALDKKEGLSAQISILQKEGETDKAFEKVEELAKTFPNSAEVLLKAGFLHQSKNNYEKAYQYFAKASSMKEINDLSSGNKRQLKNEKIAAISALYQVGRNAVLGGKQVDEGIIALESYLNLNPNQSQPSHSWAKIRLAALYLNKGNKEKAKILALEAESDKSDGGPRKMAKKLLKKIERT